MSDSRLIYDAFNIYYEKGMTALKTGNYDMAKRNLYLAAESLLKLAKLSSGSLKVQRVKRASELKELADKIAKKQEQVVTATNNGKDKNIDVSSSVVVKKNENITLEQALNKLDSLVGLESVKKQIHDWIDQFNVFQKRKKENLSTPLMTYHLVFTGNPGTGKTTVARIVAQIFCALGITKTTNFVETDRADLVAGYVGQTAIKTKEVLKKAEGGVLFIDEAYSLSSRGKQDFGQEAIDTLVKHMDDNRDNIAVIAAGYGGKPMNDFIESNVGLKSRFKTFIHFEDYSPEDLYKIFMSFCEDENYVMDNSASKLLRKLINNMYNNRGVSFGNGRDMRNLFELTITNQSRRLVSFKNPTREELMTILPCDLPIDIYGVDDKSNVNEKSESKVTTSKPKSTKIKPENEIKNKSAEEEILDGQSNLVDSEYKFEWDDLPNISFDDVAGLDDVKEEVKVKVLLPLENPEAFEGYQKKNGGGLLLYGPPGTGKTMIAAAIANEIGAKFCSVKPSDLLHQGVGNSEKAVRSLFAQARQYPCAVIYFDEMDAIAQKNTRSSYAKQMRSELLAQLQGVESYGKETGNILYLIAATNKPWDMDSAFLRPGRFGTRIYVGLPDDAARKYMIEKRLEKIKEAGLVMVDHEIDIDLVVDLTKGFNGSDMTNMLDKVEELSIIRGINEGTKYISRTDFGAALDLIKSSVQKEDIEKLNEWSISNNIY